MKGDEVLKVCHDFTILCCMDLTQNLIDHETLFITPIKDFDVGFPSHLNLFDDPPPKVLEL